jgi:6-phosphogluconolactonase/glucosamine-6-phosphate isomerase/deaminase
MNLTVKTTTKIDEAAEFIFVSIFGQLKSNKKVLFFLTGGSSIAVGAKVTELLRNISDQNLLKNLTITLTDERYGLLGHQDSNWQQLLEKGFSLPQAKLMPILTGENRDIAVGKFNENLEREFKETDYAIGLFGIGADGHTAGILPESSAVNAEGYAFGYETEKFERITITPKVIEKLDEAIIWAQGENKWPIIKNLAEAPTPKGVGVPTESVGKNNLNISKQPAQILKKVPLLTIFTDYNII